LVLFGAALAAETPEAKEVFRREHEKRLRREEFFRDQGVPTRVAVRASLASAPQSGLIARKG
jgi:hypothetical protein